MFSIELCLVKKTILAWFNKKIKSQHFEIDLLTKNKCESDEGKPKSYCATKKAHQDCSKK